MSKCFFRLISWVLFLGVFVLSSCISLQRELTAEDILDRMNEIIDPKDQIKNIKSTIITTEKISPETKMSSSSKSILCYPNKYYSESVTKGFGKTISIVNDNQAWKVSSISGVSPIEDAELEQYQFDLKSETSTNWRQHFERVELIHDTDSQNKLFYVIKCYPDSKVFPRIKPITYFIDKDKMLLRKIDLISISNNGEMLVTIYFDKYEWKNNILIATEQRTKCDGLTTNIKIIDIIINDPKIDLNIFKKPIIDLEKQEL